jgi:amidase
MIGEPVDVFATAGAMLEALRQRQISAVELLELHLRQIRRHNSALNAIVTRNDDEARLQAERADAARARGEEGALLGLPLTIKDCIYVRGLPTTGGLVERAESIADDDAPVAARVRAAGAVILGKTNVPPLAADWQSDNPLFGRSNNPWDLGRTPGGSTGGGAAAVAVGMTPLELGGDLAGSIRIPAAFCGVYGHRPSETAVPRRGHFPGLNRPNPATAMAVQGPLARSAEDLELALDVIAGPDVGEEVAWHLDLPGARYSDLADYRVGVMPLLEWLPVDDEIAGALDRLATRLGKGGAKVQEVQPRFLGDMRNYYTTFLRLMAALQSAGRSEADRHRQAGAIQESSDAFDRLAWADGLTASASDYILWFAHRERYRGSFRAFFQEWDVLLAPADLVNAFPHTDAPYIERTLEVNGEEVPYRRQSLYPCLANLSGHPATAFPAGQSRSGLPIGLQAVGPYLEDRTPIRFAALVAAAFGGYQRPPGYE